MALRSEIPRALELARGRKFKYRVRCAWGGNHLRRRDALGALLRKVSARSTDAGRSIDTAIDGYRPHADPLNPAYLGYWQSAGTPLALKAGLPYQFYEPFNDWSNWHLAAYGAATGQAASISGKWGLQSIESTVNGTKAGYSGVLFESGSAKQVARDQVFQMQLGTNRLDKSPYTAAQYGECGLVLSDSSSNDISAETNSLEILIRNDPGNDVLLTSAILYRRVVAGVASVGLLCNLFYQHADNIRVVVVAGVATIYSSVYGKLGSVSAAHLPATVYVKAYTETTVHGAPGAMHGYFRDLGIFPNRNIRVGGEPGFADEFETFAVAAWNLTTHGGNASQLTQVTRAGENAILLKSAAVDWACAMPNAVDKYSDFRYDGRFEQVNRTNIIFDAQDTTGNNTPCYVVQFDTASVILGKDLGANGAGIMTTLKTNAAAATAPGEVFTATIIRQGTRILVLKNDVPVIDTNDASYTEGLFGYQTYDAGFYCFEHRIAGRGLQQPTMLRIDRPMIQNPSFEDWDDVDGLTESIPTASSWNFDAPPYSLTLTKGVAVGPDGGSSMKIEIDGSAMAGAFLLADLRQRMIRIVTGHKYRVSYQLRFANTGGGLIGGTPFFEMGLRGDPLTDLPIDGGPRQIQIATPSENMATFDQWIARSYEFTMAEPTNDECSIKFSVHTATADATGDFAYEISQIMIEDITGLAATDVPVLAWTDRPVTYRGQAGDRVAGEDFWQPFYTMPLNILWRLGEDFTWGLIDENGRDLFTSRQYTNVLPGNIWTLRPEWIAIDLGVELDINQVLFYPYYANGIRYLLATYGGADFCSHQAMPIMQGLTVYSNMTMLDFEMETAVKARYVQIIILDSDAEGNKATCQEVELYNYSDESDRVAHQEGGAPEVTITATRPADKLNPLPDAATATVSLVNKDQRYTPYNKFSPIYGPYKQADGMGDIRAGVPIKISMLAADSAGAETESLMFQGTIGVDKNKGAALGVTVDGSAGVATIDAVDFTVPLDQPVPVSELNPIETVSAEDTMRTLCYLAGIPYQDMSFDATGVTFPVVVFRDQTLRENIQQLVQAIGGRFFSLRDGRLRYQNVAMNRSWTLTERAEFESGTKANIDTQDVPGEFWMDNAQFNINHLFRTLMPEGQVYLPWTVNGTDAWRFLGGNDYVVVTPAGQSTKMQHVLLGNCDKSVGFTHEWDVALVEKGGPFNVWGYTSDVADYTTPASAWRVSVERRSGALWIRCGGQTQWFGMTDSLFAEFVHAFQDTNDRMRLRVTVKGTNCSIYLNDHLYRTVPLVTPKQIRWNAYESSAAYKDDWSTVGALNGWAGDDVNTTGDVWHDLAGRWRIDNHLHKNGTTEDWSAYLDFSCPNWRMKGDLYLDRTTAREGGWMMRYIDANNWIALRVTSTPDPNNGWLIIIGLSIVARRAGGPVQTLATFPNEAHAYEGGQHFVLDANPFGLRVFLSKYNPVWQQYTEWHQVGYYPLDFTTLGTALCGATKMGPFYFGGTNNGCSWDAVDIVNGSGSVITLTGPAASYDLEGGGHVSMNTTAEVHYNDDVWNSAPADTYSGKVAMGLDPAAYAFQQNPSNFPGWDTVGFALTTGYRLAYFRHKFSGDIAPLDGGYNGVLTSPVKDLTAAVLSWGIFEAEVKGVGRAIYNGLFDQTSNVDFYMQSSADGTTWDQWVKVIRGQLIPAAVALQRYVRWQARFWRSYQPWIALGFPLSQYRFYNYWKAHVLSITVNWQISAAVTDNWFRATWDVKAGEDAETEGVEMNSSQYSLGNPEANRVTALVNRWVEQAITNSGVSTDPFWESSELPAVLNIGDVYVINAEYSYPSKKGTGGTLRHVHVDVAGTGYIVNDGAGDVACGSATVRFDSGQGVGTITITSAANGLAINSAKIDAICYKPASDLYGTERVFAEDVASQEMLGRIIDTETFDNAFAMSRAIAQDYANAELVRTKQYNETIQGVQIPIMPSLSLEHYGVVHNPVMGVYERQVQPMEITHQGFTTVITCQGIRTQETTDEFLPLSLSPTSAFATFRLPGCASNYIMRVRSELTGEEFDVYDFQQYFEHYQLAAGGEWIDAADEDFRVVTLYDQSGNSRDLIQATPADQPILLLNARNGLPVLALDGIGDSLQSAGFTLDDFINAGAGHIFVTARPEGAVPTGAEAWNLGMMVSDSMLYMGISYGDKAGGGDKIHAFNFGATEADAQANCIRDNWSIIEWSHGAGVLTLDQDAEVKDFVASANTAAVNNPLTVGGVAGGGAIHGQGRVSAMFTFDVVQALADREKLVGFMQAH